MSEIRIQKTGEPDVIAASETLDDLIVVAAPSRLLRTPQLLLGITPSDKWSVVHWYPHSACRRRVPPSRSRQLLKAVWRRSKSWRDTGR